MSQIESMEPLINHMNELRERSENLLCRVAANLPAASESKSPFLGFGSSLFAVILQEAAPLQQEESWPEIAAAHLRHAMDLFERTPLSSSLYRGITGLGWTIANFEAKHLLPDSQEFLSDLDELLAEGIEITGKPNLDIVNGLAGIVVYALARGASQSSSADLWKTLDSVLTKILESWHVGPAHSESSAYNNFGVAHGMPGLLAVAATAANRSYCSARTREAVSSGLDRLWSHSLLLHDHRTFAIRFGVPDEARLAWCYGSLGLASLYLQGASIDAANAHRFLQLVEAAMHQYDRGTHGIRDASLCHGHAGVALAFSYFSARGGLSEHHKNALDARAANAGLRALDAEQRSIADGHYTYWSAEGMKPSASLLEGNSGVALSMVAAASRTHRPWMDLLAYF